MRQIESEKNPRNRERKRYFGTTLSVIVYIVWYTNIYTSHHVLSCDSQLILFLGFVVNCPSTKFFQTQPELVQLDRTCITKTMFVFVFFLELEDDILCKISRQTCFSPLFRKQVLAIRIFLSSSILWKVRVDASQGHILVNTKHRI